jgi:hypothetical protein
MTWDQGAAEAILDAVAEEHNVTRYAILGRSLNPGHPEARHEFWWRLLNDLNMPRKDIAAAFRKPLRTVETGIALRAKAHGLEARDHRRSPDKHAALKKMLREGASYDEINRQLGYSIKSLPTMSHRLRAFYAGIRATPERPAIPEPLAPEYRRLMLVERLNPVDAAKRLNLVLPTTDLT